MALASTKRRLVGYCDLELSAWMEREAMRRRVSAAWLVVEACQQFRNRLDAARARAKPEAREVVEEVENLEELL